MEGAPRRVRNRLVSGAAEPRAAAAGGTQRALVSGLRAAGDRDACVARAGPGPAPVPCPRPAPGWPRTAQAVSHHSLAGQGEKKKKEKAGKWHQGPLPSRLYELQSQQHAQHERQLWYPPHTQLHLPQTGAEVTPGALREHFGEGKPALSLPQCTQHPRPRAGCCATPRAAGSQLWGPGR